MTDVYLICSEPVLRRALEIEISARGADVRDYSGKITPPYALVISAADFHDGILPAEGDFPAVVFGYPCELEKIPPSQQTVFLKRPFTSGELLSLIFGNDDGAHPSLRRRSISDKLQINAKARTVGFGNKTVKLSKCEFSLFMYLYERRGQAVLRSEAYAAVWGKGGGEQVVDVYICYLREKVEEPLGIKLIRTERGKGYFFEI